jgi:hypothetical protein
MLAQSLVNLLVSLFLQASRLTLLEPKLEVGASNSTA